MPKKIISTPEKTESSTPSKKVCFYCSSHSEPTYTNTVVLRKAISERSRIIPKQRTGACSKHQRAITLQVKYARHLALLPFV